MLRSGKHMGKQFARVAHEDRNYCAWVLRDGQQHANFHEFAEWLRCHHAGIVDFGVHRGKFYDELEKNEGYCRWAMSLRDPTDRMKEFIRYLRGRRARGTTDGAEGRDPKRRKKVDHSDGADQRPTCKICIDADIGAVFYPCGHASCEACSNKIADCPFCRAEILLVVKAYI